MVWRVKSLIASAVRAGLWVKCRARYRRGEADKNEKTDRSEPHGEGSCSVRLAVSYAVTLHLQKSAPRHHSTGGPQFDRVRLSPGLFGA